MLDQESPHAQCGANPLRFALEACGPRLVVLDELDWTVVAGALADRHSSLASSGPTAGDITGPVP
jgi:hypothetical protein